MVDQAEDNKECYNRKKNTSYVYNILNIDPFHYIIYIYNGYYVYCI